MSKFSRIYHLCFGLFDAIAIITAFILSLKVINPFFSYFTVLSNILITILFLYFAFTKVKKISKTLEWMYGSAVLYMTLTGIIYWTILVNQHSLSIDPWINLTMHGLMPIVSLAGWILFPPQHKLIYKNALQWLIPPLIFVAYTLIRGQFINWYPYPFLNPDTSGSYFKLGINISLLLLLFYLIGLFLIWTANLSKRKE